MWLGVVAEKPLLLAEEIPPSIQKKGSRTPDKAVELAPITLDTTLTPLPFRRWTLSKHYSINHLIPLHGLFSVILTCRIFPVLSALPRARCPWLLNSIGCSQQQVSQGSQVKVLRNRLIKATKKTLSCCLLPILSCASSSTTFLLRFAVFRNYPMQWTVESLVPNEKVLPFQLHCFLLFVSAKHQQLLPLVGGSRTGHHQS